MRSSADRLRTACLACACFACFGLPAHAGDDDTVLAPTVSVTADKPESELGAVPDTTGTTYTTDADMLEQATGGGGVNPMRAIALLPGIDSPAIDPFGFANIPGSNKGVRIRGELNPHGNSIGTLDGLPVMGVNPGPGYLFLVDNENLSGITVYQGAIAPDHLAYFTTTGVVDSHLRWPESTPEAELSQSFGDYGFMRSVLRADTGDIADSGVSLFASASWSQADKWRGEGKSPDGKNGIAFGLAAEPIAGLMAKLFFAHSDMKQDTYRGLTYAQATDLKTYRFLDFNTSSSATASEAILYQGYNRQDFTDWVVLGELQYRLNNTIGFMLKPYYFHEDGEYLDGMAAKGKVRDWLIDHNAYGLTFEADAHVLGGEIKLGYWWSSLMPPGPPTAWKMYTPQADGSMTFAMWSILAKEVKRHVFNTANVTAARDFGPLHIEAGGRYVWESIPGFNQYNTTGLGDVSYKAALAAASGIVASRSVTGYGKEAFLPRAAISYQIAPDLTAKISTGRNYGAPGFEAWPVFQANASIFLASGVVADDLWRGIKPETSVVTDVSLRWDFDGAYGSGYIEPTAYYANYQNKSVSYDSGIGIAFNRNVGTTHAHGIQISARYVPFDSLGLFASVAYAHNVFGDDLPVLSSASSTTAAAVMVKGKDVPDAPTWTAAFGATLKLGDFSLSPVGRYVGSRYGDSLNTQQVPDYLVFDVSATYDIAVPYGKIVLSLSVDNVFDKRYIGFINSGYYQATSASGGIYFPGAPRAVWGKIAFKL